MALEPTKNPASSPKFDPDSLDPQSESSLRELIGCIESEKKTLQFTKFSQADAVTLGLLLVELGRERNLPIAIDIRRSNHILFHASLPGATPDNEIWIKKKARTAGRYAEPSLLAGLRARLGGGSGLEGNAWFDQMRYSPHGGAFPLYVKGTGAVAIVTVSGLSQKADHDLVIEALSLFLDSQEMP